MLKRWAKRHDEFGRYVVPLLDTQDHVEASALCWCKPHLTYYHDGSILLVHRAQDRRDEGETVEVHRLM